MANKKAISTALKRNLKDGKEYSKLIPPVRCERTDLGSGDTFFTVDAMKDWVEKYQDQTAKLAPVLVGRDLEETVNNIYEFLYSHIQYQADGALQQLRSPACAWVQRKDGVDCKSFSVFASSILTNLGIKHFIRQIRQPYFYPEEFTHVYVVVPINQNEIGKSATFVLDATKHQNIESIYLEKVDLVMNLKHIGLNGAHPDRAQQIIENFERFSRFLLEKGVPLATVNRVRERVSHFTERGKDLEFEIVHDGLRIEGVTFPLQFNQHVPFLAIRNILNGGLKGNHPSSFFQVFSSNGTLNGLNAESEGGIVEAGIELASGAIPFGGIIQAVLGPMNLTENINNILEYGFSSWGASSTPEEMEKRFAERAYPWVQNQLASITPQNLEEKINLIDFTLRVNMLYFKLLRDEHSEAESTRLANDWATNECQKLLTEAIDGINDSLQAEGVTVSRRRATSTSDLPATTAYYFWKDALLHHGDGWTYNDMFVYKVDTASLSAWQKAQNIVTGGSTNPDINTDINTDYQTAPTGQISTTPTEKKGGKTGLIIGGMALAAAPFFFMAKKDDLKKAVKSVKEKSKK